MEYLNNRFIKRVVEFLRRMSVLEGSIVEATNEMLMAVFSTLETRLASTAKALEPNEVQFHRFTEIKATMFDVTFSADAGSSFWNGRLVDFSRSLVST